MATANELREMKPEELDRMVSEQRDALFNLRLKLRTGHLENTASLGAARREIARLTTILHEAQLGIVHRAKAAQVVAGSSGEAHPQAHVRRTAAHRKPAARPKTKTAKKAKSPKKTGR